MNDLKCLRPKLPAWSAALLALLLNGAATPHGMGRVPRLNQVAASEPPILLCDPNDRPPVRWVTQPAAGPGVEYHTYWSDAADAVVSYHVYLPPSYSSGNKSYPVVYWLHGSGNPTAGIPSVASLFDDAIRAGIAPELIIVFPNGLPYGMWTDSYDGRTPIETMLVHELIPLIDAQFRTIPDRTARMIEGFSMGGYGAARIGLGHPDLFAAASLFGSGPLQLSLSNAPRATRRSVQMILCSVYGGRPDLFVELSPWCIAETNADVLGSGVVTIRQVVGELDETLPANVDFHEHLQQIGIPHEFVTLPRVRHNPLRTITARGNMHWQFYCDVFGNP